VSDERAMLSAGAMRMMGASSEETANVPLYVVSAAPTRRTAEASSEETANVPLYVVSAAPTRRTAEAP
jgi:hypothetical protein